MEINEYEKKRLRHSPSRRAQLSLFARNFFKHPKMLGSIIPSSPFLVRRMLSHVDWQRARVLVEYGPGVGTFTREILRQMHPEAVLIVLETNEDFVGFLNRTYPDPRLKIIHGSAENIREFLSEGGIDSADYVIAGIPFSTLPSTIQENILRSTQQAISPTGAFLLYQFSSKIHPHLRRVFSHVKPTFEPLNFLPAHFYYCEP